MKNIPRRWISRLATAVLVATGVLLAVAAPWVTTVGPNGISNPVRGCSSGSPISGGFTVTDDSGFTVVTASLPTRDFSINSDMWKWNFKNWDTVAHTIEQTLVCLG